MPKRRKYKHPPKPPGDAANYIRVRTREGTHWRRKRGTVTPAKLNNSFKKNANTSSITSPAAKRIKERLQPFLLRLDTGRYIANVSGRLKKAYNKTGKLDLTVLKDYDMQPYFLLSDILHLPYTVINKNNEVIIKIPIRASAVSQHNQIVTGYFFEAIQLYGSLEKENGLRVESDTSPVYKFNETKADCRLSVVLPAKKTSWALFLKLSCYEGKQLAHHSRHYGMKVVSVGSTEG